LIARYTAAVEKEDISAITHPLSKIEHFYFP